MSFSTNDFEKWMKKQGPVIRDPADSTLSDGQIKILENYPECQSANDLPFDIQEMVIELDKDNSATTTEAQLQQEVDSFLENQYSLLSRKFQKQKDNEPA